jgi:hypothetical protein
VALPPYATNCGPWHRQGEDSWQRHVFVREWDVAGVWVSVAGEQHHLGEASVWLHVGGEDRCTGFDQRQLITALMEAGELLDSLT